MTKNIEYISPNGYTGVLYGHSSLSIHDKDGREVMHTGSRTINTYEELVEFVEGFPELYEMLLEVMK